MTPIFKEVGPESCVTIIGAGKELPVASSWYMWMRMTRAPGRMSAASAVSAPPKARPSACLPRSLKPFMVGVLNTVAMMTRGQPVGPCLSNAPRPRSDGAGIRIWVSATS